mmetsp:Transcript_17947/g.24888  ORF Transcript_17947/g.24888 Transcript_17947/m.24888 type:complete len:171 (-) Transcript_17947:288-800(-)|eukprot:jgi/Bigna1/50953/estExt_Genewise1.C_1020002
MSGKNGSKKSSAKGPKGVKQVEITLTEGQTKQIRSAFDLFDTKGTGVMKLSELNVALRGLGLELKKTELKRVVHDADKDNSGTIDFPEFLAVIRKQMSHRMSKNDVSKAFNIFDPEGTGEISLNNLEEVAKQLGEDMTREELGEMLAMMQGKNKATREAFLSYMKQTGIY